MVRSSRLAGDEAIPVDSFLECPVLSDADGGPGMELRTGRAGRLGLGAYFAMGAGGPSPMWLLSVESELPLAVGTSRQGEEPLGRRGRFTTSTGACGPSAGSRVSR